jgi:hypothetical protein
VSLQNEGGTIPKKHLKLRVGERYIKITQMKNFIFLIAMAVFVTKGFSQNFEMYNKTRFYELIVPTYVKEDKAGAKPVLTQGKLKFTVLKEDKEGVLVQFWSWDTTGNKEKIAIFNFNDMNRKDTKGSVIEDTDNVKVFRIPSEDFKNNAIPYFNAGFELGTLDWSSGIVVLPVKVRNSPKYTYSKDLSLGLSGGGRWRISHRNPTYLNFLINAGISSVSVDSVSTNGRIRQPSDRAALTTAIGLVFENHAFQFGFFYGNWIYNRKPWLSFGIGYQLFSSGNKSKESKAGKQ